MVRIAQQDDIMSDLMRAAQQLGLKEGDIDTILARLDAIGAPGRQKAVWEDLPLPGVFLPGAPQR